MADPHSAIDAAIEEVTRARTILGRGSTHQVRGQDERAALKGVALTWLRQHHHHVLLQLGTESVEQITIAYLEILEWADRHILRSRYDASLKSIRKSLLKVRSELVVMPVDSSTDDSPPDFSPLVADQQMQAVLIRRWDETLRCMKCEAHLAATVMMGGLLEALLLARVNRLADKRPVFTAVGAPRNKEGNTLRLNEWTLRHYIDVGHELGWITHSAKQVGEVLRDYRNYVHPQKELSHGVVLVEEDSRMFWGLTKSLAGQVIGSVR